jgi:type IV pilus assembly protein PilQ
VQAILLALWLASAPDLNPVRSVDYAVLHPGEVLIRIELARPLAQPPSGFRTFHPAPSVVLELPGTAVAPNQKAIQPERGLVSRIRLVGHATGTRLVIDLTASATYETAVQGSALLVTLRRTPPARTGDRWQRFGAAPPQYLLRDLRFERGPGGAGSVHVNATPMTGIDVRQEGRHLIVTFLDTGIDAPGERRLDVLDFATPIEAIQVRSAGRDALLLIETGGAFEYSARQAHAGFTLTVTPRVQAR